ncbi:MAG: site-2 protease family protein [Phycisphaeraceae bacterium]|nr:site-2 protease family protein [Phycisphaeraceae bacterium]
MSNTLLAFVAFFAGFSFLIFIHELGHFVVARYVGIKCTQFAIGMGQALCSWRRGMGWRAGSTEAEYERQIREHLREQGIDPETATKLIEHREDFTAPGRNEKALPSTYADQAAAELGLGETEYRINWLPLGGYVKMLGQEDMDPSARSSDPRSFNSKSVGARMAVISAGVIMNLVLGMILLTLAFQIGVAFQTNIIGYVDPDSPAGVTYAQGHENDPAFQGLQVGDTVTNIDGDIIKDFMDLRLAVALSNPEYPLTVEVKRKCVEQPLQFVMKPKTDDRREQNLPSIGVASIDSLQVDKLTRQFPASAAGLDENMHLAAVDGQALNDYADYYQAIMSQPARRRTLSFLDKDGRGVEYQVSAEPQLQSHNIDQVDGGTLVLKHLLGLQTAAYVGVVTPKSAAEKAGVKVGDLIVRLGDMNWPTPAEVMLTVQQTGLQPLQLVVLRDGQRVDLGPVRPQASGLLGKIGLAGQGKLGVLCTQSPNEVRIGRTLPESPAAALNLPNGARLVKVNDQPVQNWAEFQMAVAKAESPDLKLSFELPIARDPIEESTLHLDDQQLAAVREAGWNMPVDFVLKPLELPLKAEGLLSAPKLGLEKTGDFMVQTYLMLARLFQRSVKVEHLVGPIGIVHAGTTFTERGVPYCLFFLGLLSVNLAVVNFLPIPIVDGGHAVFLIIEKLKGSPVSIKVQAAATYAGLAFIALVFLLVTYYDIVRLVKPQ